MIKTKKESYNSPEKKDADSLTAFSKTISVTGRIRKIGNSKGIILSNSMLKKLNIEENAAVIVTTGNGQITIKPVENKRNINTDLSTWEAHYKVAMKNGDKPEKNLFEGTENTFDKEEW